MHDDEASAAFSSQIRERARRGRFTSEAEGPMVAALREHSAALASGSDDEIRAAREKVDQLIAEHHERQLPDFGAGARPMQQEQPDTTTLIRRARNHYQESAMTIQIRHHDVFAVGLPPAEVIAVASIATAVEAYQAARRERVAAWNTAASSAARRAEAVEADSRLLADALERGEQDPGSPHTEAVEREIADNRRKAEALDLVLQRRLEAVQAALDEGSDEWTRRSRPSGPSSPPLARAARPRRRGARQPHGASDDRALHDQREMVEPLRQPDGGRGHRRAEGVVPFGQVLDRVSCKKSLRLNATNLGRSGAAHRVDDLEPVSKAGKQIHDLTRVEQGRIS